MLAIQSDIAKYNCIYTQGTVAFQTPGVLFLFYSPGIFVNIRFDISCVPLPITLLRYNSETPKQIKTNGFRLLVCFQFILGGLVRISSY